MEKNVGDLDAKLRLALGFDSGFLPLSGYLRPVREHCALIVVGFIDFLPKMDLEIVIRPCFLGNVSAIMQCGVRPFHKNEISR